ncbi:xylulokinase [Streptomyces shenzhenensis]|uniref:xylulokinase n=1 Tax=Streptomyces shenzhenensis TaxID=943815 RepID=UPI0033CCE420
MTESRTDHTADERKLLLGVDVGGSGARVAAFTVDGALVASGRAPYAPHFDTDGTSYYRIPEVQQAVVDALAEMFASRLVAASEIAAVSSSLNNWMIAGYGDDGEPVTDYMFFLDPRMTDRIATVHAELEAGGVSADTYLRRVYTAPRLLSALTSIREQEPELFARVRRWACSVQPFVYGLLGGHTDVEPEDTLGGTGIYDVFQHRFDPAITSAIGVGEDDWAAPVYPGAFCGVVSAEGAARSGLVKGTPLFAGVADRLAEMYGQGAISEKHINIGMGTTSVVSRLTKSQPEYSPAIQVMGGGDDATIRVGFGIGFFGRALQWAHDALSYGTLNQHELAELIQGGGGFDAMMKVAATSPAGANGVVFLPQFMGLPENPDVRATFTGITPFTTAGDIIRSVLEGLVFELHGGIAAISQSTGGGITTAYATGGPTRSGVWTQIIADILDMPVLITDVASDLAACKGAAIVAGVGLGVYDDVADAARRAVGEVRRFEPQEPEAAFYREAMQHYRSLRTALSDHVYV